MAKCAKKQTEAIAMSIYAGFAVPHPPLIIHEVGRGEEQKIQATIDAYMHVARRIADIKPTTIIISSPHAPAYYDAFAIAPGPTLSGDMGEFRASGVHIACDIDTELVDEIVHASQSAHIRVSKEAWRGAPLDYAALIPLHFIQKKYTNFHVVEIGISGCSAQDHFTLGHIVAQCCKRLGRRSVWVASGDFSHKLTEDGPYGFDPAGPKFDEAICKIFRDNTLDKLFHLDPSMCKNAAYCGLPSWQMMAGYLSDHETESTLLHYEGPFGVGYGVAEFTVVDPYVHLAKRAVYAYVMKHEVLNISDNVPDIMKERKAAVFVTIQKNGQLRGCIGTLRPFYANIAEEIIHNAISACSRDPRFAPITSDELSALTFSVDVLSEPAPCAQRDLDPKHFGVIVSNNMRKGVLLPHLDGVDSVEMQISIAKQKAGIAPHEPCKLEKFSVVRHYQDHAEEI